MGVNLLPFIDRERLISAMKRADNNSQKLSKVEQERNKPTGKIFMYFNKSSKKDSS